MWCTRWFLPLLLLPLPTAPPYFLLLFLLSLTIHAKPCFYCIVLLTTLFISSCYWQPFPIDSPLTTPWADNITTFAEALNATIAPNYSRPLPTVMRVVDRCWCDFSVGSFFDPFNVSHWEDISIARLSQSLERQQQLEDVHAQEELESRNGSDTQGLFISTKQESLPSTINNVVPTTSLVVSLGLWSRLKSLTEKSKASPVLSDIFPVQPSTTDLHNNVPLANETSPVTQTQPSPPANTLSSLFRQEYDLRPYGFGMVVDLRWS